MLKIKRGKSEGHGNPAADHFVNGPHSLLVHLSRLFSAMLSHSYVPNEMLVSSIVPVPKNVKKSLCSTDNYRSIAIGSILSKVLDNIII